jgi:hypothetical protein
MLKSIFTAVLSLFALLQTLPAPSLMANETDRKLILGSWVLKMDIGPSKGDGALDIEETNGKLVVKITAPDGTKLQTENVKFEKSHIVFEATKSMTIFKAVLNFEGEVKENKIQGKVKMAGGPMKDTGNWQAERKR